MTVLKALGPEMHTYDLSPKFVHDSFIGGLKDSLKSFVKAFNLETIPQAIHYARLQQESLNVGHIPKASTNNTTTRYSIPKQGEA